MLPAGRGVSSPAGQGRGFSFNLRRRSPEAPDGGSRPMMVQIPDVLTLEQVRRCRELLDRATWHDGRRTAGDMAARVKANQQLAEDDPLTVQLGDFILKRLG